jgi:PilZ domain
MRWTFTTARKVLVAPLPVKRFVTRSRSGILLILRHERRQHFRGKARPGRVLPIRFRAAGHTAWIVAETRNIGVGGAFIVSQFVQPVGAQLTAELILPTSDQAFLLPAVVRWGNAEGMGVQFVGVDVDVLLELNDFFATLTGT